MNARERFNLLKEIEARLKSLDTTVLYFGHAHEKLLLDVRKAYALLRDLHDTLTREEEEKDNGKPAT